MGKLLSLIVGLLLLAADAMAFPYGGGAVVSGGGGGTGVLPSFQVTSTLGGTNVLPFTVGMPLVKGAAVGPIHLSVPNSDCAILRLWNDGSDKEVVCSGRTSLVVNVPATISLVAGSATGVALTCADIAAAAPSASVTISTASPSVVTLASVLAVPFRAYVSSVEMADCHYKATASNGLTVFFYVRLYRDGRMFVRVAVDNGWVDQDFGDLSYTATATIGGTNVLAPTALVHYDHTRWTATGWIGTDPQVTPKHDTAYMVSTKLVPNFFMDPPTAARLNSLYQTYTYATLGDGDSNEPGTGAQFQIGLMPGWEALYVTSGADSRAYKAVLANAAQEFGFGIVWRTHSDNDLVVRPSNQPARTCVSNTPGGDGGESGSCGFGATIPGGATLTWDLCHSSNAGLVPFMITGEYFYAELLQMKAAVGYLQAGNATLGTSRNIFHITVRCPAWHMRTIGSLAAIAPLDSVTSDYQALLATNATIAKNQVQTAGQNQLGILYEYDLFQGCHGVSTCSLFMEYFMTQTFGFVSDLEPLGSMTDWNTARNYQYTLPKQLLGTASGSDFCYTWANGEFDFKYATVQVTSVTDPNFPPNFGGVWTLSGSAGLNNGTCTNTMQGSSGGDPATGGSSFWANMLPAVSFGVDHGFAGMQAGLSRWTGTTNWSTFRNAIDSAGTNSFANYPQFGIQPRGQHL